MPARPTVILAVGWALFVLFAYPGAMTEEAFASTGALHLVWRALDAIVVAPFGVVAAQSIVWLAGAYWIAGRFATPPAAALAACAALLAAPVLGGMAVVSSHAAAVALALVAAAIAVRLAGRWRWLAVAPAALAAWLVITAGDASIVNDKDRLLAAGIPWSKTPLQRGLEHAIVRPHGILLWLASAACYGIACVVAHRFSPRD